jgi:outer membrane protein OmpA-like peptidoglycan-associated protein
MKKILFAILLLYSSTANAQKTTVLFDFAKYELTNQARHTLDSLLLAPEFRAVTITLSGHTDSLGSAAYNDILSRNRLNAVQKYLTDHGFAENNIRETTVFGETKPLNKNGNELQRLANRRVEISFTVEVKDAQSQVQKSIQERISDSSTKAGSNIILHNLNFYGGRHIILPQSQPILSELLEALRTNPSVAIEIQGHICCSPGAGDGLDIDTHTYNLSVTRAREIYSYLINNGINVSRLSYKGFAHSMPLVYPEDTEEKRATNRRVEIKVIKK